MKTSQIIAKLSECFPEKHKQYDVDGLTQEAKFSGQKKKKNQQTKSCSEQKFDSGLALCIKKIFG